MGKASLPPVTRDNVIDAASGLYWYATHHHTGQGHYLYAVTSALGYRPGALESGPDASAQEFYDALVLGDWDALALSEAILKIYESSAE